MFIGVQTHFNGWVDPQTLQTLHAKGFRMARVDVQALSPQDGLRLVADTVASGLEPLVIVATFEQLRAMPEGTMVEWQNEPDLALGRPTPIPPKQYAQDFRIACEIAQEKGLLLYGPVVSNLNKRGFDYFAAMGELPANARISVHRYGDGTFRTPHKLNKYWPLGRFHSRDEELDHLKAITNNRPFGVSEFGYPLRDEAKQAQYLQQELQLFKDHGADFAVIYQLNDDPNFKDYSFGIRRPDGTWKPSADLPKMIAYANEPFSGWGTGDLIQLGNGDVAVDLGNNLVLSVQPDGSYQTRPITAIGPWESAKKLGNKLVFNIEGKIFIVPVLEGL